MLFDKKIEPSCSYCRRGKAIGHDMYVCVKKGIMFGYGFCGSFRYEPTKREPPLLPSISGFARSGFCEDDFTL